MWLFLQTPQVYIICTVIILSKFSSQNKLVDINFKQLLFLINSNKSLWHGIFEKKTESQGN